MGEGRQDYQPAGDQEHEAGEWQGGQRSAQVADRQDETGDQQEETAQGWQQAEPSAQGGR